MGVIDSIWKARRSLESMTSRKIVLSAQHSILVDTIHVTNSFYILQSTAGQGVISHINDVDNPRPICFKIYDDIQTTYFCIEHVCLLVQRYNEIVFKSQIHNK